MSEKSEGKPEGGETQPTAEDLAAEQARCGASAAMLANALRFEQAKNKVLLDEVVALEDEMVNRSLADFDAVITDDTREFWREQLLSNRDGATAALKEILRGRTVGADGARRPLHNRALSRPLVPTAAGGAPAGGAGGADDRAAKIRNRAHEISRGERIPFSAAFRRAEREFVGN